MEVDFLTHDQIDSLLKITTKSKHKLQILFLADAGVRVSEMIQLQWEDLDFRTRHIRVKSLKKRNDDIKRVLPMSSRLYDALADHIEKIGGRGTGYIFSTDNGASHITRQAVNKMLKVAENENPEVENVHPHKLRHSFATSLRAHGAELEDIRDALGHSRLETSLIYAHQDKEKLRDLINAPLQKKPGIIDRITRLIKPQRRRPIVSILEYDPSYSVGREAEVKKIESAIEKNISVVLLGQVGVGKTHLLNAVRFKKTVLEIDDLKDFRTSLLGILLFLFNGDKKQAAEMIYKKNERDHLHRTMVKESVVSLVDLLIQITGRREYILRISDIDNLTPSVSRALEKLKTHFTIITTCRQIKINAIFIYDFEKIELHNLNRVESLRLFHKLCNQVKYYNVEQARNKVYETSAGNPKMIVELCTRLSKEEILEPEIVNEICDNYIGRQSREIDMTIFVFLLLVGVMSLRYIGNESNDPDLRMIGGLMMIVLLVFRSFFRKSKRTVL